MPKIQGQFLKNNKKWIYIFIGLMVLSIMIYVILLPNPGSISPAIVSDAGAKFQTNAGEKYTATHYTLENFNLPRATLKLYTFTSDINPIFNKINSQIAGLTAEAPSNSNLEKLYSSNYTFTFNKSLKYLTFLNIEQASSIFDGYDQNNALRKLSTLLGVDLNNYSKIDSATDSYGYTTLSFTIRLDGLNFELPNNNNSNLDITISKLGKMTNFDWTVAEVKDGISVKEMDSAFLKSNFENIKKYFYKDPQGIAVITGTTGLPNNQGVPLDISSFKGTIDIKSASLVYFNQPDASSYIIPTFKLRAQFIQDSDKSESTGFVYIPAYVP